MPKLNATHLPERIQEHLATMESGEEYDAKKDRTLLTDELRKALDDAWVTQQALRKTHKPPKAKEDKQRIGWKTIREVRIDIYKQALEQLQANVVDDTRKLQKQRESKAAKVFMDAWSKAIDEGKRGISAESAGNIALTRAHLRPAAPMVNARDKKIQKLEKQILEQAEDRLTDEEREHLDWLRDSKKPAKKAKKA
jgi:RNA polymerase-interacting CarD/CdnL/TRCF family regulator